MTTKSFAFMNRRWNDGTKENPYRPQKLWIPTEYTAFFQIRVLVFYSPDFSLSQEFVNVTIIHHWRQTELRESGTKAEKLSQFAGGAFETTGSRSSEPRPWAPCGSLCEHFLAFQAYFPWSGFQNGSYTFCKFLAPFRLFHRTLYLHFSNPCVLNALFHQLTHNKNPIWNISTIRSTPWLTEHRQSLLFIKNWIK